MRANRHWGDARVTVEGLAAIVALVIVMGIFVVLFMTIEGCVAGRGWTRADVPESELQSVLDGDRAECERDALAKPVVYRLIFGAVDVASCLEGAGWVRVK